MRILITGVTGLLGRALSQALVRRGATVLGTARRNLDPERAIYRWDALRDPFPVRWLEGVDAVVHLAGESIAGLWTPARRRRIRDSRVEGSRRLVHALRSAGFSGTVVAASAVGYYGHRGEEVLTEESPPGKGFLAEVVQQWERVWAEAPGRVVVLRLGVVMALEGGAFPGLFRVARWGMGVGWRGHWLAWVSVEDAVRAVIHVLENPRLSGVVNVTAPEGVLWCTFWRTLAGGRPSWCLPRPPWLPGQVGDLTASQRVIPRRLQEAGFSWEFPSFPRWWSAVGKRNG